MMKMNISPQVVIYIKMKIFEYLDSLLTNHKDIHEKQKK